MKYLLFLFSVIFGLNSFGQHSNVNEILLKDDYAKVQNKIYKISNSNVSYKSKQVESFDILKEFIRKYPASENSLYLIASAVNQTLEEIDSLISLLDTSLNKSPYKASVNVTRKRISVTETGKLFPNYNFVDTLGQAMSIENLKGKTILLDFWSSWCSPCREQIPDLVKIYSKYKNEGFEILGISMDENKSAWLNAIKKDKQTWIQFCELVNWRGNKASKYFSIYGIPSNFLLNKNGIIIGQDLSTDLIKNILSKQ